VGIGITSPTRKLAVAGTWTNTGDYIMDSDSPVIQWTSGTLRFVTGGVNRVLIDSSGRVTTPYQPAFRAAITTTVLYTTTASDILFNSVSFNTGSYYNSGTGAFTAPVAGVYSFYIRAFIEVAGRATVDVRVNGTSVASSYGPTEQGDNCSTMVVVSLSAGDTVSCRLRQGTIYGGGGVDTSMFMGYLIG
jgi:hypothetical protein